MTPQIVTPDLTRFGRAYRLDLTEVRVPVWSWLPPERIEQGALIQLQHLAALPCAFHIAVMPDIHKGYGMPIGCVLATLNAVVPYAVGVDIGCGMVAMQLGVPFDAAKARTREILERVYQEVPVGQPTKLNPTQGRFTTRQDSDVLREWYDDATASGRWTAQDAQKLRGKSDAQVGTLGGGNHFIELQADTENNVWLMLHTGSRAFGHAICMRYFERATWWTKRFYTPLSDPDLAFLPTDTEDGRNYIRDMNFAMRFAEENRARIADRALAAVAAVVGHVNPDTPIETHHNYASFEKHLGQRVIVHRKGAVSTERGVTVTIPGSMQTGSYIGFGIENKMALNTCSHGAGRIYGRNEMRRRYGEVMAKQGDFEDVPSGLTASGDKYVSVADEMQAQGVELVCPEGSDCLDEAGRAYKDIQSVMEYQSDLVRPVHVLRPLGVVKG